MQTRTRRDSDLPWVVPMLVAAGLPPDGLERTIGWVIEDQGRILGHVAAETRSDAAVLRSLVVDPAAQGRGLGLELLQTAEQAMGSRSLVLKTETVGPWMERHGYMRVTVDRVPPSVRDTTQFAGALCSQCPIYLKRPGGTLLDPATIKSEVRLRYGAIASGNGGCCGPASSCGCGNPVALASLEAGEVVLDLGSGSSNDAPAAAR